MKLTKKVKSYLDLFSFLGVIWALSLILCIWAPVEVMIIIAVLSSTIVIMSYILFGLIFGKFK